jgi:response regulator RpfG family c-di-GMP phosphodiesterase
MIHVLYLDDEELNLTAFRAAFRRVFQVFVTTEPTEAVRMLREHPIEVIISDQKMPNLSGVEFFELITPDHPDPVRMLLTGHADIDAVIDAINKGQVYKYISKPWNEAELESLVREAAGVFHRRKNVAEAGQRLVEKMDEARLYAKDIITRVDPPRDLMATQVEDIAGLAHRIDETLKGPNNPAA